MHIDSKIECVKREIKRRKKFYPKLVEDGKFEQEWADLELASMQAVLETLTNIKGALDA